MQLLESLLHSYERYYDINTETPAMPFKAEAVFRSHNEQFMLVKAAKIADIDSNEYVFFSENESFSLEQLQSLAEKAWNEGQSRIKPYNGHRNSDITLIAVCEKAEEEIFSKAKKIRYYKSYCFGFYGWSNFRLVVHEVSSSRTVSNWQGRDLKKLFNKAN